MPRVPSSLVHQAQIAASVERAAKALAPDVVRIRFSIDDNWDGDESVIFRVVLSDEASYPNQLREVSKRARAVIRDEVKAHELGLNTYFNFRSLYETKELPEAAWD
jgi:hypothetical protein